MKLHALQRKGATSADHCAFFLPPRQKRSPLLRSRWRSKDSFRRIASLPAGSYRRPSSATHTPCHRTNVASSQDIKGRASSPVLFFFSPSASLTSPLLRRLSHLEAYFYFLQSLEMKFTAPLAFAVLAALNACSAQPVAAGAGAAGVGAAGVGAAGAGTAGAGTAATAGQGMVRPASAGAVSCARYTGSVAAARNFQRGDGIASNSWRGPQGQHALFNTFTTDLSLFASGSNAVSVFVLEVTNSLNGVIQYSPAFQVHRGATCTVNVGRDVYGSRFRYNVKGF